MKALSPIAVFFLVMVYSTTFAQLTEKEAKDKLKKLTPAEYLSILKDLEEMKAENSELKSEVSRLKESLQESTSETAKLEEKIKKLESAPVSTTSTTITQSQPKVKSSENGVVFKVQIGAFKNKDLIKYFKNNPNFSGDVDQDGQKKYTLGNFSDYWEADNFKKYLREMGVKDAWIVSYKDGKRVPIKDVLEGAL